MKDFGKNILNSSKYCDLAITLVEISQVLRNVHATGMAAGMQNLLPPVGSNKNEHQNLKLGQRSGKQT